MIEFLVDAGDAVWKPSCFILFCLFLHFIIHYSAMRTARQVNWWSREEAAAAAGGVGGGGGAGGDVHGRKQNKNRQVVPSSDNWHAVVVCQSPSNKSSPSLTPSSPAPAALSNSTNLLKMYGCSSNKTHSAPGAKDVGLRWTRHSAAHWPPGPFSAHTEEWGQRPWKQGQLHRENICLQLCLTA